MKKSLLYTRGGDAGQTSLVGGERIAKNSLRVSAYGEVDELNAFIGVVRAHTELLALPEVNGLLARVQSVMFDLGAYLATPAGKGVLTVTAADVAELERAIDVLDASVPPQRTFILPGGSVASAHAHVARAVCRRAERAVLTLADSGEEVDPRVMEYVNRLSDYLFILARYLNHTASIPDIPWLPRK